MLLLCKFLKKCSAILLRLFSSSCSSLMERMCCLTFPFSETPQRFFIWLKAGEMLGQVIVFWVLFFLHFPSLETLVWFWQSSVDPFYAGIFIFCQALGDGSHLVSQHSGIVCAAYKCCLPFALVQVHIITLQPLRYVLVMFTRNILDPFWAEAFSLRLVFVRLLFVLFSKFESKLSQKFLQTRIPPALNRLFLRGRWWKQCTVSGITADGQPLWLYLVVLYLLLYILNTAAAAFLVLPRTFLDLGVDQRCHT